MPKKTGNLALLEQRLAEVKKRSTRKADRIEEARKSGITLYIDPGTSTIGVEAELYLAQLQSESETPRE